MVVVAAAKGRTSNGPAIPPKRPLREEVKLPASCGRRCDGEALVGGMGSVGEICGLEGEGGREGLGGSGGVQ